ncbi:MAG: FHA domain-containing protein, partial [Myxococcota bacterium]
MVKLCIEDDEGQQTIVPLSRDEITIGRAEGNTIRLTERNVSRRHAKLIKRDGKVFLEEISARYGTRKNGEKLTQAEELREGDVVLIGDYRLSLQNSAGRTPSEPSSGSFSKKMPEGFEKPAPLGPNPRSSVPRSQDGTEILPAKPAKLVIVSSNFAGQEFLLSRQEMVIGRDEACDIVIDHRSVSSKHAKVLRDSPISYQILDLQSKNGVRIGPELYQHVALKRGDIIELGHVKFRFVAAGENYVFSPQSILPDTPLDSPPEHGVRKAAVVLVALMIVALVVVAAVFLDEIIGADEDTKDQIEPSVAATTNEQVDKESENKIDEGVENARALIERGDIDKALGVLEGLKNYSNPNAEQREKLDELLSVARR